MDLLNYDDETTCPECDGVGRVKIVKPESFDKEEPKLDYTCAEDLKTCERKIYKLSIREFKALMVDCFEMLKQRETDTSVKEYKRLTIDDISTRNGVPVPKEY